MNDRIEFLSQDNYEVFKQFCMTYRTVHDESFLYDEDFDDFVIGEDNPTSLLYRDERLVGVCSLIQDDFRLKANSARVRQFYCESETLEDYKSLFGKVLPLNSQVKKIIMFVPTHKKSSRKILEAMGFVIERYAYVMERCDEASLDYQFPEGYELTDYRYGIDDEAYLTVRNTAFASLKGSEIPHTKEQITKYMQPGQILKGGAKILRYAGEPVGIIRVEHENEEGKDYSFIAPIAMMPEHQGKGLGAMLLRVGIQVGVDNGYPDCMLSVNLENENALKLYTKEGFKTTLEVVCYHLNV